jgi:hypothetical protein
MTDDTLAMAFAELRPLGPPDPELRSRRQALADFIRGIEPRVHSATGAAREQVRAALGWDDASLDRFIRSPMIVHSATHASMNAFAPMLAFPWLCQTLVESAASRGIPATHLRTLVTHNNLSDNRWKPHVWWHLDSGGDVRCTRLFSKSRSREHQVLLCQPVPAIPSGGLADLDLSAVRLAGHATNYAYFAILYRLVLERALGFHSPDGTVEIPIDLMNAFSLRGTEGSWSQALYDMGLPLRRVTPASELEYLGCPDTSMIAEADPLNIRDTLISHNFINVGLAFRLGLSVTMGAEKMTVYEAEMNEVLADFFTRIGERAYFPGFLGVRSLDLQKVAPLPARTEEQLAALGGRRSLPVYAAVYGASLRDRLDGMLSQPRGGLADVVTRSLRDGAGREGTPLGAR